MTHTAVRVCGTAPIQLGQRCRAACITASASTIHPISGLKAASLILLIDSAASTTPMHAGRSIRRTYSQRTCWCSAATAQTSPATSSGST